MTSYFDSEQSISSIKSAFLAYTNLEREDTDPLLSNAKVSFLASTTTSDLVDLLEYEGDFKFDKDKYKKYLLCNYFDKFTRNIVGNNLDDLDIVNNVILPQISSDTSSKEITDNEGIDNEYNNYFGMFVDNEKSYIILDIPGNIPLVFFYTEENSKELFDSSYVDDEFNYTSNINSFIENHNPIIALKFGSEPNLKESGEISYEITKELTDRKIICIEISSSEDKITDIDIYKASWNFNINKYRSMNKFSVRNDYFLETYKKDINPTRLENDFLVDKNSDVLLGILDNSRNQPIYNRKLLKTKIENSNNYYTYYYGNVYDNTYGIKEDNNIYNSLENNNINNLIELEKYWNSGNKFTNSYDEDDNSSFIFYQIMINSNDFGTVIPSGMISINKNTVKNNKELLNSIITSSPLNGYYLDYILFNDEKITSLSEINNNGILYYVFSPILVYIPIKFYNTDNDLIDIPDGSLSYTYYNVTEDKNYSSPIIINNNYLKFSFGNYSIRITLEIISNISEKYELENDTFDIEINSSKLLKDSDESNILSDSLNVILKEKEYKLSIVDNTINKNNTSSYYINLECTTEIYYSYDDSISFTIYNINNFTSIDDYRNVINIYHNDDLYDGEYEIVYNSSNKTCTINIFNIRTDSLTVTLD